MARVSRSPIVQHRRHADSVGQAAPLLMAVVVIAAMVALALARLGVAISTRQQAQVAADAAALAGVDGGTAAASRLAASNGGSLVSFRVDGGDVEVVVVVAGHRATARATRAP